MESVILGIEGFAFGVVAGVFASLIFKPRSKSSNQTWSSLRHAADHAGYRDREHEVIRTWAEVVEAVRAAGLRPTEAQDRFELNDAEGHRLTVIATEPGRVTLRSLEVIDTASETLVFELAHALLEPFGPMIVTEANFGRFVVDGTTTVEALRAQREERIEKLAQGVLRNVEDSRAAFAEMGLES